MKRVFFACLLIPLLVIYTIPEHSMAMEERSVQEELIYDILVDRYNNGNTSNDEDVDIDDPYAFHGGDLEGITKKLDDLEELGFSTIALSPIMKNSSDGYHGYWVEDFYEVDAHFGSKDDLDKLIKEAHERDIKVVLEVVTNYIGPSNDITDDDSKDDWLDGQASDEDIPWMDDIDVLDQTNEEAREFLFDVSDYWMEETDIDGFKLHAADEADEAFLHDLSTHIKDKNDNFLLIADILYPENDNDDLKNEEAIDLVEDESFYEMMTDSLAEVDQPVDEILEDVSDKSLLYVDNKDTERFTQRFGDNGRKALTVWELALTLMYTIPGTPSVYQGSEIPMYGEGFPESQDMVQFTNEDDDLKEFYHRLSSLHDEFPALTEGDFEVVDSSGAMSVFKRFTEDETVFVAVNNDSESHAVSVDDVESGKQLRGLLEDDIVREEDDGTFTISVPRETADIFVIESDTGMNWPFIIIIGGVFLLFPIFVLTVSIKQKRRKNA